MNSITILPMKIEKCIQRYIGEKFEQDNLKAEFPNPLIREDVFDLLDKYCTVVYFPLENENNNGFHVTDMPFLNGDKRNFVFINTAQTIEKQVFTAAHELGHIWKVDDYVIENEDEVEDSSDIREKIINRFAATLLMPSDIFKETADSLIKELGIGKQTIKLSTELKLIVKLMNYFFAPKKAVIIRLLEHELIPNSIANLLTTEDKELNEVVNSYMEKLFSDYGYIKFENPSMKKWIKGLSEILDEAERKQVIPLQKIKHMRDTFDLKSIESSEQIDDMFNLTKGL